MHVISGPKEYTLKAYQEKLQKHFKNFTLYDFKVSGGSLYAWEQLVGDG